MPRGPRPNVPKRNRAPYGTQQYKSFKQYLRTHIVPCWVRDDNGKCWRRGTVPDHVPPIATVPDPTNWHGKLMPMCAYHSCKQSGMVRTGRTYRPEPTRQW